MLENLVVPFVKGDLVFIMYSEVLPDLKLLSLLGWSYPGWETLKAA
jgi:hypothetical protein